MTIGSTAPRVSFACNGVSTVFPVPIQAYLASDFEVIHTTAAGVESIVVLNSDYSLATAGTLAPPAWSLTTLAAAPYPTGDTLQVFINPVQNQQTNYVQGQAFPSLAVLTNFDRLTQMVQRLQDQLNRTVLAPDGDVSPAMGLPIASVRALSYLAFDANGNVLPTAALPGTANTAASLGPILNPRTSGEINALPVAVFPVNFIYPAQTALRYGNNTIPGTTPMDAAIQAAIDSAYSASATVLIADQNALSKPLLLRSTTQESIGLYGNARVVTELEPLGTTIATLPVNINAALICQNSNVHLHLSHLRSADGSFTGYFMYALPGGGADGSCRASFSMVVDDCWFSPSSNGSGVFYGFYSNMQMNNCVFESTKAGCVRMVAGTAGGGSSDILCQNITMNQCFDAFLLGTDDTSVKPLLTVNGLHAYGHLRGQLFQINNGIALHFSDVTCEAAVGQINTVGLFNLQDCAEIDLHNMICHSRVGVPQGAGPNGIINGATGKISDIIADTLIGLQFTGAGVLNLEVVNCDFSGANLPLSFPTGTQTGQIIFRGCRFNNCANECVSGGISANIDFFECEFLNAGIGTSSANNNVDLNIAAGVTVNFIRCKFGQNTGTALAGSFFKFVGTGTVNIIDPTMVGVAPTSLLNAGSTLAINWDGINSNTPGFTTAVPSAGGTSVSTGYFNWSLKGRVLSFSGRLSITTIGTGSASTIGGLPFVSNAANYGGGTVFNITGSNANVTSLGFRVAPATTAMTLVGLQAAAAATITISALANGTDLIFQGAYPL